MPARRSGRSESVAQGPPSVAATASDHPASWKFDFPIYHPPDLAAWRAWLTASCDTVRGVWLASWTPNADTSWPR